MSRPSALWLLSVFFEFARQYGHQMAGRVPARRLQEFLFAAKCHSVAVEEIQGQAMHNRVVRLHGIVDLVRTAVSGFPGQKPVGESDDALVSVNHRSRARYL